MKILRNTIPISDLFHLMSNGELVVNRTYQRSKGLWPDNSRSYFIDTILCEYPFPKVVIRQTVDLKSKKSMREIIDGQQRLTTIKDFIEDKFKLTSVSKSFAGSRFSELDDEIQSTFLAYEVSVDSILSATTEEILEIFRRINSYTLPLNKTEQRHAIYQGEFKWLISDLAKYSSPFFEEHKILTVRDISRMMDTDLITECFQLNIEGVQNRSAKKLDNIYKMYNEKFVARTKLESQYLDTFNFIKDNLSDVFEQSAVKPYIFYSLFGALSFNKYGLPDEKDDLENYTSEGQFVSDLNETKDQLVRMFVAVEEKDVDGEFKDFVNASIATTHSYKNRLTRLQNIIRVL